MLVICRVFRRRNAGQIETKSCRVRIFHRFAAALSAMIPSNLDE